MKVKLGVVIEREMKSLGLTVTSLAKKAEVPRTTLHDWIQGRLPSSRNIHHLSQLSEFFDITLSELLFDSKERSSESEILFSSEFRDQGNRYKIVIEKIKTR